QGLVKLLDFGVARCNNGHTTMTSTGQMIGTLDYLAPEQASNPRDVDGRADIYSLGCTLYFLLTGEAPFSGPAYDTPASKIKGHLVDAPAPLLGNRCSQLPRAVAGIIERMMAKSPDDRYQTPLDVALALTSYGRNSNLAALVDTSYDPTMYRALVQSQNSILGALAKGCWHAVWFIPLCLLWLFSRLFRKRPQSGFHPVRSSFMSLSGVVGIGVLIYMLSHVVRIDRFSGHSPIPKTIIISNDAPPVELTPITVAPAPANVSKSREPLGITNKFVAPAGAREATGKQRTK
ncbi:MAG: protein kinase, partial [Planctomycetaceae bacterium]|nr:protein kinase [Planctomycetaceae bacterium]